MIKFENTEVFNFEGAIRGMRNPLNSWDKSDSEFFSVGAELTDGKMVAGKGIILGKNDLALMKKLINAGSDHRKFMRQILVSVDIIAPFYWWKEFDTYKVGTVANSCSTMHKIHAKEFTLDDFSIEHLEPFAKSMFEVYMGYLNAYRNKFNTTKDKEHWYHMIQMLPTSYNQKRTVTLNYETLRNIYGSRKNHKLDEWSIGFMEWIESLPYASELITDRS